MFKKIFSSAIFSFLLITSFLSADIKYDINDIDTLQTHSSEAIALNNQGQILGWYNIDGSKDGKHFFVRNSNGSFHELPGIVGAAVEWKYLTDDGKAYGTHPVSATSVALCVWDRHNGAVKLGNLPGKEISAINNAGQVLIKSISEVQGGRTIYRPVVWEYGSVTKLKGLEGELGIESEESYGFDINNKGEVVGQSLTSLVYKNNIYYQIHAVKWVKGQAIDLHNTVIKQEKTSASAINDLGEVLINHADFKLNNLGDYYYPHQGWDKKGTRVFSTSSLNHEISKDSNSIWMKVVKIISVNDKREMIVEAQTVYGEKHAMFLTPSKIR